MRQAGEWGDHGVCVRAGSGVITVCASGQEGVITVCASRRRAG